MASSYYKPIPVSPEPKGHRHHDHSSSSPQTVSDQVTFTLREGPFVSNAAKGASFSQLRRNLRPQIRLKTMRAFYRVSAVLGALTPISFRPTFGRGN